MAKDLDDALWRRFDFILEFKAPAQKVLVNFALQLASEKRVQLGDESLAKAAKAKNFANAEAVVLAEARKQALRDF